MGEVCESQTTLQQQGITKPVERNTKKTLKLGWGGYISADLFF